MTWWDLMIWATIIFVAFIPAMWEYHKSQSRPKPEHVTLILASDVRKAIIRVLAEDAEIATDNATENIK